MTEERLMAARFQHGRWRDELRTTASLLARRTPPFRGKTRLLRAFDRLVRPQDNELVTKVEGVLWSLRTEDLIQFRILYQELASPGIVKWLQRELRGKQVLWDVGANVGSVCLPLALRASWATVEAFEPSPGPAGRLRRHLAMNPALGGRIRLHELALSDRTGEVQFHPSNEGHNSGVGSLTAMHNTVVTPIAVQSATGDELVAASLCQPPDVVKIDVEGWEAEVMRGMSQVIERTRPGILFEHAPYRIRARGLPLDGSIRWLRDRGYSLRAIDPKGEEGELDSLSRDMDISARPQST